MYRVIPGDRVVVESRPASFVVLGHERVVLDRQVVALLTRARRAVSDWFLIGECVCFWGQHEDIGEWLTSDDGLSQAVRDYLQRIGAPVDTSCAAARQARAGQAKGSGHPRE